VVQAEPVGSSTPASKGRTHAPFEQTAEAGHAWQELPKLPHAATESPVRHTPF